MASLVESVQKVLVNVNRIADPPPYAIYSTAYEVLAFADQGSLGSALEALLQSPFLNMYWLACAAAASVRLAQLLKGSGSNSNGGSMKSLSSFDAIILEWFSEECSHSEGGEGNSSNGAHSGNGAFKYFGATATTTTSAAAAASSSSSASLAVISAEDVAVIVSCVWDHLNSGGDGVAESSGAFPSVIGEGTVVGAALRSLQGYAASSASGMGGGMLVGSAIAVLGHIVSRLKQKRSGNSGAVATATADAGDARRAECDATVGRCIVSIAADAITARNDSSSSRLVPLITRQILIPLLNLYPASEACGVALTLIERTSAAGRHTDVVVLAASLFEALTAATSVSGGGDDATTPPTPTPTRQQCPLRCNEHVWTAIVRVLEATILGAGTESQRATAQLQAVHLLQRIVSLCEDEWGQNKEALKARTKQNAHSSANNGKGGKGKGAKGKNSKAEAEAAEEAAAAVPKAAVATRTGSFVFHELFAWGEDPQFGAAWNDFFLILEALNEYSLHICSQVVVKIPTLLEKGSLLPIADASSTSASTLRAIEPLFVDLLLQKGLTHANNAVRKAVLGTLWRDLSLPCIALLKEQTVYEVAFTTAADCRLCSEADKLVAPSAFMEVPQRPEEEVPSSVIDPIADLMCQFYRRVLTSSSSSTSPAASRLLRMITNLSERSPRFAVAMGMRVISDVCCGVATLVPTAAVFDAFCGVHQLALRGRHQMWMEGRCEALMVEAVLGLMANLDGEAGHVAYPTDAEREAVALRGWKVLAAAGSVAEDPLDAPAVHTNSFCGAQYVCERIVATLSAPSPSTASSVLDLCVKSAGTLSEEVNRIVSGGGGEKLLGDAELRELALRIGTALASPCPSAASSAASIVVLLLGACASLGSRTCASGAMTVNVCQLIKCIVAVVGVKGMCAAGASAPIRAAVPDEGLVMAYQGAMMASGRVASEMRGALERGAPAADANAQLSVVDALCDVGAIALGLLCARCTIDGPSCALGGPVAEIVFQHVLEWCNGVFSTAQGGGSSSPLSAAHMMRTSLRGLRCIVVANAMAVAATAAPGGEPTTSAASAAGAVLAPIVPCVAVALTAGGHPIAAQLLHFLANPEAPLPLCADRRAFAGMNSEIERYQFDLVGFALSLTVVAAPPQKEDGLVAARALCAWAAEVVCDCAPHNLVTLYSIMALCVAELGKKTSSPGGADDSNADVELQVSTLRLMQAHAQDGLRIHAYRCTALAYGALGYCKDDDYVIGFISKLLAAEDAVARMIFFCALAVTTKVLAAVAGGPAALAPVWELYKPLLLEFILFINTAAVEDDEMVCAFAALEPAFAALPDGIRARLPPTTRLVTLARVLATVTYGECVKALGIAQQTLVDLVLMNTKDKRIAHSPCMPNSRVHRSRLRLWQLIHSLVPLVDDKGGDWAVLIPLLQDECVPIGNIASVRRPIDLMLMLAYQRRPDLLPMLLPKLDDYDMRAQVAGSFAQVAINTMLTHIGDEAVFAALYPRLLRIGNSYQHLLRIIAHIGIHAVLTRRKQRSSASSPFPEDHERMLHYLDNAAEVQKFLHKYQHVVLLDVELEMSAGRNYCVQRMDGPHWLHEGIPAATFGRIAYLHNEVPCAMSLALPLQTQQAQSLLVGNAVGAALRRAYASQVQLGMIPRAVPIRAAASTNANDEFLDYNEVSRKIQMEAQEAKDKAAAGAAQEGGEGAEGEGTATAVANNSDNIQRKVQSWWTSEIYNQLHPRALGASTRQSLIIVGSLLDNPVNIAGLCRCGDIFAVERVIVPNKKVFEHPHFVAAARSAELWVPWEEVAPRDLTTYLQRMRLEGYTIVGVEQTADSQSMANFGFPPRAVVVLGAEGTGVPAEVLPYLDVCVEIPQFGLIRSLNVHVTGAIAMYEYSVQHMMNNTTRPAHMGGAAAIAE